MANRRYREDTLLVAPKVEDEDLLLEDAHVLSSLEEEVVEWRQAVGIDLVDHHP